MPPAGTTRSGAFISGTSSLAPESDSTQVSAPHRTRTYNPLIKSGQGDGSNPLPVNTSGDGDAPHVPQHVPTARTDPDLARVVTAWPDLPPHIRAAVLALIRAAR